MAVTNENFADEAMKVMQKMKGSRLTTSQIRKIWGYIVRVYDRARRTQGKMLDRETVHDLQYAKMKIYYEAGREQAVKHFVNDAGIIRMIDGIGNNKEKFMLFCNYMESLVAFHKFFERG